MILPDDILKASRPQPIGQRRAVADGVARLRGDRLVGEKVSHGDALAEPIGGFTISDRGGLTRKFKDIS